ncbi:MAG: rRNA methyltransferase [Verrucomicrobiaceae bacterium]|nr:rRNA methyltransferase [Verrucomicrobiaceae bacterium]
MDKSLQLLINNMASASGETVWVADEHVNDAVLAQVHPRADFRVLTNRCDIAARCEARGINVTLNDFIFPENVALAHVFFRVAKEKALVHHVINAGLAALAAGGTLWLSGEKNEGIKTYLEKAAARAGRVAELERGSGCTLGAIARTQQLGAELDDQFYPQLRHLQFDEVFSAWSKPGIFGWQKIDSGSEFLIEHLHDVFVEPPARVLDLGCGYGYLSLSAALRWPRAEFIATDNNLTAVTTCARNFSENKIQGEVIAADCGENVAGKFPAILCNPPFHQGFDVEADLTLRFLQGARRLLARGGRALFVVNHFIGLEKQAQPLFARVEVVARNKGFKLIALDA